MPFSQFIMIIAMPNSKGAEMSEEKKKNLFDRAIDALTDRDEKEAEAKAVDERVAAAKVAAEKAAADKAAAAKRVADQAAATKAEADKRAAEQMAAMKAANEKVAAVAPKMGIVAVRSLRIRADHNTTSEVVAGLVDGDEVTILDTWSDGKDTWAKLDKGWAAMVYNGEAYI